MRQDACFPARGKIGDELGRGLVRLLSELSPTRIVQGLILPTGREKFVQEH